MYDQKNIQLTVTRAGFFRIEVPGVSEKRPSILRGDKVLIRFYISEGKILLCIGL